MIKKDWSKSLFDVCLLDYKNNNSNKQKENIYLKGFSDNMKWYSTTELL